MSPLPPQTAAPADAPAVPLGGKAETQERILRAAVTLFAERGFDRATISTIADRARVSRSAVFWHFGNKEGLFREAFRHMITPFFEEVRATFAHLRPHEQVFELVATYERVVDTHDESIRAIIRWLLESEKLRALTLESLFRLHDKFVGDVRRALEELYSDQREAAALAAAVVSLLDGNLLLSMLDPSLKNLKLRREGVRRIAARLLSEPHAD